MQTDQIRKRLLEIVDENDLLEQEPMLRHTTFHAGGPAAFMASPDGEEQLRSLILLCEEEKLPWMLLGRGSNLLVSDAGYDGVMISLREHFQEISADPENGLITAQAGALLSAVSNRACECGLTGLEFAQGIPGTIGGGLFMNAGAYGGELGRVTVSVRAMRKDGSIAEIAGEEADFGYRTSRFRKEGLYVLSCVLSLSKGDPEAIAARMKELSEKRREKQPLEFYSGGSTFKRPEGYFAGQLIESAGLKGYSVGDAQVSEKHAGFVINRRDASAADILAVCRHVQETVFSVHGVRLEMEVIPVGEF